MCSTTLPILFILKMFGLIVNFHPTSGSLHCEDTGLLIRTGSDTSPCFSLLRHTGAGLVCEHVSETERDSVCVRLCWLPRLQASTNHHLIKVKLIIRQSANLPTFLNNLLGKCPAEAFPKIQSYCRHLMSHILSRSLVCF